MSNAMPPTPLRQEDYLAIEAAVMETARGRWFLSEYARRNRNSDTDTLLAAIDKLEKTVIRERAPATVMERVKLDLADMAAAIERTKKEIAQIKHENNDGAERFERASLELDAIVSQTESATGEILGAAEKIQEYAWTLREMGADEDKCNELDMEATNIYMSCSFQDLTGQRIKKIVDAMRYVESRINSMIDIWGFESQTVEVDHTHAKSHDERPDAHLLNGPAIQGEGVEQSDVDMLLNHEHDHEDESNQDDVDALFDSAPARVEAGQDDVDALFDSAPDCAEAGQDDVDALFHPAPSNSTAELDMTADADQSDIDALLAETDFDTAETGNVADVDEVELNDLDWAVADNETTAKQDTAGDVAQTEIPEHGKAGNGEAGEADIFAQASEADEAVEPVAQADVFAGVTIDNVEADIFAAAPADDDDDPEKLKGSIADLRDRVAEFS